MRSIQTKSIMIQKLCVPCCSHCQYCLLSWDGKVVGASANSAQADRRSAAQRIELCWIDGFGIMIRYENGSVIIYANKEGLLSLAKGEKRYAPLSLT